MAELKKIDGRLCLCFSPRQGWKPFCVDFLPLHRRVRSQINRNDPLIKAMGSWGSAAESERPSVFDATMGFATDAFILAHWGARVFACEQNETIFSLVEDGLRNCSFSPSSLTIAQGNACEQKQPFDIVYLDPMFPLKDKTAKSPKAMQVLQYLVGVENQQDSLALFAVAKSMAKNRVVVKRPDHAKPLLDDPDFSIKGKTVRFDVYLTKK